MPTWLNYIAALPPGADLRPVGAPSSGRGYHGPVVHVPIFLEQGNAFTHPHTTHRIMCTATLEPHRPLPLQTLHTTEAGDHDADVGSRHWRPWPVRGGCVICCIWTLHKLCLHYASGATHLLRGVYEPLLVTSGDVTDCLLTLRRAEFEHAHTQNSAPGNLRPLLAMPPVPSATCSM